MKNLRLVGGYVVTPLEARFTDVLIKDDRIHALGDVRINGENEEVIDVSGCIVTPGLIDLQVNGGRACDLWADPSDDEIRELCRELKESGVTSFLPTLITDDLTHLRKNIDRLTALGAGGDEEAARRFSVRMAGIHLEGPCLSPDKPGVHPKEHIQGLSVDVLEKIIVPSVRLVTLAPERDPSGSALDFLRSKSVAVSLGHSNATFDEARTAFDRGVHLVTHTFNALPSIHHREPGAVAAALLDERVSCCIICDGLHVHPDVVCLLMRVKGASRTVLVTDAAHVGTTGGGLVGSSIMLRDAIVNVVSWKAATFEQAIRMATFNPARAIGMEEHIGHIAPGKYADIVVWEAENLTIKYVIVSGAVVHRAAGLAVPGGVRT